MPRGPGTRGGVSERRLTLLQPCARGALLHPPLFIYVGEECVFNKKKGSNGKCRLGSGSSSVWYVPFGAHVMQVKVLVSAWNLAGWRRGFGLSWQVLRSDCNLRWIQLGDATSAGQINLLRQWQRDSILDGLVDGH